MNTLMFRLRGASRLPEGRRSAGPCPGVIQLLRVTACGFVAFLVTAFSCDDSGTGLLTCDIERTNWLAPDAIQLQVLQSVTLKAVIEYDGDCSQPVATIQSTDPSIATVVFGPLPTPMFYQTERDVIVTGVAPGSVRVALSFDFPADNLTAYDTTVVTVSQQVVASVAVSPLSTSVNVGSTVPFSAQANDALGQPIANVTFAWASSNQQVASVDQSGRVTGVAPGTADITASAGGKSGQARVTVLTQSGTLDVVAATTGVDLDADDYLASVGADSRTLGVNGTVQYTLTAGLHQVALQGVAANCTVAGPNPRSVSVVAGATVQTRFDVTCVREQRIAFRSNRDGDYEIFTMRQDGTDLRQLTTNTVDDVDSRWSSDGARIVFSRGGDIWVMDADGANQRAVLSRAGEDDDPDWSPNGSRIVFAGDAADGSREVFVMNADGSNVQPLTNAAGDSWKPRFSPDGAKIAFASDRFGNEDVFTMDADGRNVMRLTTDPAPDNYPAWSLDGTQIVFASSRDSDFELWLMNADGTNQTQLTFNTFADVSPSMAADRSIVFSTNRTGNVEIFVLTQAAQLQLTNHPGIDEYPDWRVKWPSSPGSGARRRPPSR